MSRRATPAVVVGAGINGLGVARSLARARVPVCLLDSDAHRAEMHTRAATCWPLRAGQGEALVEELLRLGAGQFAGMRPVLLLTQEEAVRAVSGQREPLSAYYRFTLPAADVVETLQHKYGFQQLAEQFGAPIPPLVHVRSPADMAALEALHYPAVIKPGTRHAQYARQFRKAYRVDNVHAAAALVRRILPVLADVVVQEWIEGPDSNIYFCLQHLGANGVVSASFCGRKIRSWPPATGGTASCVAAPEVAAELTATTTKFFRAAGVTGLASMEYKRDARSGVLRMVEPTIGRTDYQEEVATLNGVNLPLAAYCAELGRAVPVPAPTRRPVVWRVRSEDVQSALAQGQRSGDGIPRGARVVDALWRWSDPMPAVVHLARRVRRGVSHRAARVMPGSQAAGSRP